MEGVGLAGARPSKERRRHLTLTLSPEAERGSLPLRFDAPGQVGWDISNEEEEEEDFGAARGGMYLFLAVRPLGPR